MIFNSKVDLWVAAAIAVGPLAMVGAAVAGVASGEAAALWGGLIGLVFLVLLYGGVLFPIRYSLEDGQLVVQSGRLKTRIPYEAIVGVRPSRNLISSPALSLDRLHVDHGKKLQTYISPADKSAFLDALAAAAPHLERRGDELVATLE